MKRILIALLALSLGACASNQSKEKLMVKTTSYSSKERDSLPYGNKNAIGTNLLYGPTRSAASDWSRWPLGMEFRIKGLPYTYIICDYGSGLVGTDKIDLYFPTLKLMREWGTQTVEIIIIKPGSYIQSRAILADRARFPHIRKMLVAINSLPQNRLN